MRDRKELEEELRHFAERDSNRDYAFAEMRLILEAVLDVRELLQNQHVQMRAIALQALVDTMQQTKIEAIGYTQDAQGAWHGEESHEP